MVVGRGRAYSFGNAAKRVVIERRSLFPGHHRIPKQAVTAKINLPLFPQVAIEPVSECGVLGMQGIDLCAAHRYPTGR